VTLELPPAFIRHLEATPTAELAMIYNQGAPFGGGDTYVARVDRSDAPAVVFPGTDLTSTFTLLDPAYLYGVSDMKFYKLQAPLQSTPLPASLRSVAGDPTGGYHVVRPR
jgi:hypothetical protein